jgi:MFS family permease
VYRLDWIEQLKLKLTAAPATGTVLTVSPVVWSLGFTSLLTDISTEMVNSALPVYLVLHLHLSPIQYGVIDGIYNGLAVALLSIAAGVIADRWARHKEVAGFGYVLSAACKLLLLVAGSAWGWIAAVVGLDRVGKGIRSAPRDALISFNSRREVMASAFAVHRSLDAGGALLGPVVAFLLLAQIPGAFDVLWLTSFVFAVIGCGVIALFVPGSRTPQAIQARTKGTASDAPEAAAQPAPAQLNSSSAPERPSALRETFRLLGTKQFGAIGCCALLLAASTVSDGFIYLVLQERTGTNSSFLPLFYVGTASFYMLFSVPAGRLADRIGHRRILLGGYAVLGIVYAALLVVPNAGWPAVIVCLALMGIYYAGTEGILMALTSTVLPARLRTSGLALIGTALGLGKMLSSVVFGWVWSGLGQTAAITSFVGGMICIIIVANLWLRRAFQEQGVVQKA